MVAYSFKAGFVGAIERGEKTQTIRAHRKRHARVGEHIQLYTGMRTKNCRKIIADPICARVDEIIMPENCWSFDRDYEPITINGIPITLYELEAFALADGFRSSEHFSASYAMRRFWNRYHGLGRFEGVVIRWWAAE